MRKQLYTLFLLLVSLSSMAQIGGDYDPANPSDPGKPVQKYTLTLNANPSNGGSFNTTNTKVSAGERYNLRAYPSSDYVFVAWLCGKDTLSKAASYDYTMPPHHVDITGVFAYDPSSPADPQEQALKYQLSLVAEPMNSGSFNFSNERFAVGSSNSLRAYSNSDFVFSHWTIGDSVLSTDANLDFVMPSHSVQIVGHFKYDPVSPANPNANYWNKELGEVIVDDFTPGNLGSAVSSVISGSDRSDVAMIIVAGKMNDNDFGVANNYTNCTLLDLSRVTGIAEVPSYAFDYTNLESVSLPATIEKIGAHAFYDCKQLAALTIYAMLPPYLESNVFTGVPEGLIVYVPAAAIAKYQEDEFWRMCTLLPIQEDIRSISISLPNGTDVNDYAHMWLELTNTKSGQKIHYVMTDRNTYTFSNIIRNTTWKATLRNERGDVFGIIDNVELKDEDVSVTFSSLSKPQNVTLSVKAPDGSDVTNKTQVTWLDTDGNYLAQAAGLSGLPSGYSVGYKVALSQELAMQYVVPLQTNCVISDANNNLTIILEPLKQITLSGCVKDFVSKTGLSGATVTASQAFGGKYSKTVSTKTDSKGNYSLTVSNVPTSLAVSTSNYISQTILCDSLMTGNENVIISDISLKEISGTVVTLDLTYTKCPTEDGNEETFQEWYADYNNVAYSIYNKTKQKSINQFNVQYPQIVLLEEVDEGDVLEMTATSKVNAFMPVKTTATIDAEQRANAAFNIVELGKIKSVFTKNSNAAVVGSLYDANGKLVKSYDYSNASLTINDLIDGSYTLVTMGSSKLFNSIYDLSQLPQTGLVLGSDYTQTTVDVKSGKVCAIDIAEVPSLDESKLYYTSDNTSFTVNKSSIVAGNYLTMTGHLDFKSAYASNVSNVNLIVDLPESCEFVENSVMVGNNTSSYIIQNNRITIPMARYTDRLRFCIIPTLGGEYAPSALVQFDIDGKTITQPIGSANYTAKDLSISVPSTVAKTTIPVSGTAIGVSSIEIYDGNVLIGQTNSQPNGFWTAVCEFNEPYNMSSHNIYARITTKNGLKLMSETVSCIYDMNAISAKTVEMSFYNAYMKKNINVMFDLENQTSDATSYSFYNEADFTFAANLSNNDTTFVKGVNIKVYTDHQDWIELKASYDGNIDRWIAVHKFGSGNLPIGVKVNIESVNFALADRTHIDKLAKDIEDGYEKASNLKQEYDSLQNECEIIDIETKIVVSAIDSLLTLYSNNDPISKIDSVIVEILRLSDLDFNESDIDLSPVEYESVSELISAAEELLKDTLEIDMDYYLDYFKQIDIFLEGDTLVDYSQMFTERNEKISFLDIDGDMQEVYHISRYDIDWAEWTDSDSLDFGTTQGDSVYVYLKGKNVLVLDCKTDSAWVVQGIPLDKLSVLRLKKTIDSSDVLNALSDAIFSVERIISAATIRIEELAKPVKNEIKEIDESLKWCGQEIDKLYAMRYAGNARIAKIEQFIKGLDSEIKTQSEAIFLEKCKLQKKSLEEERNRLLKQRREYSTAIGELNKQKSALNSRRILKAAFVGQCVEVGQLIKNLYDVVKYGYNGISDYNKWTSFIRSIKCEEDKEAAENLIQLSESNRDSHCRGYVGAMAVSGIAASITGFMQVNAAAKAAKFVVKFVADLISDWLQNTAEAIYKEVSTNSQNDYNARKKDKEKLKCHKDDDDDDDDDKDDNDDDEPPFPTVDPIHDPSGFVYEGVFSNRVEGVTATCFYKEEVEDMYGDLHEDIVKWDAEAYAQENPLFTDEFGMYAWDVPQGLWQVRFEKEGYETTYSEWLPVPPPQLDVNIAMKQNVQPNVKNARAYEEAVEVEFDKYMMPELLNTDNIIVMVGDKQVEGDIKLLNEEVKYEGEFETFASKLRFNATSPFEGKEVTLMVNNRVKSYAGIRMQDNFSQVFAIEKEIQEIICDSSMVVGCGDTRVVSVTVLPSSASSGKTLCVKSSSSAILKAAKTSVEIGDDGKAEIQIRGELPGTAALIFTLDGYDISATTIVNVDYNENPGVTIPLPTPSIVSGSSVYHGTEVTLTADSEEQKIWYTTDGTCPCDENGSRRLYTGPIAINSDITIKAMAENDDEDASDVATFVYKILQSKDGVSLNAGWNWISFNMKNDALSSTNTALASGSWTSNDIVKDDKSLDMYSANQKQWIGTLSKQGMLTNDKMYKLHSSRGQKINLVGDAVNPAENAITVNPGWNYISYLPLLDMSLDDALVGYMAENGDVIKSQDAFATYSSANGWEGDLETLTVGCGYMLKRASNASKTSFVYPTKGVKVSAKHRSASAPHYYYADNMNVVGVIEGITIEDGDSIVAYVNGEVRGACKLAENEKVFLTIHGDENASVALVLLRDGEIVSTANDLIAYRSDTMIGSSYAPTSIIFMSEEENNNGDIGSVRAIYSINGLKVDPKRFNNAPTGTYIIYSEKSGKTCVSKYFKR